MKKDNVQLKEKLFKPSKTEDYGIEIIPYNTDNILSIGISTGGSAEIRMARKYPSAKIIATTLDKKGMEFSKKVIAKYGLSSQIKVKLEDVRDDMLYPNNSFDLVYARLVLHYLTFEELQKALDQINRVLRPGGLFYLVMHNKSDRTIIKNTKEYDPETNLTTFVGANKDVFQRQFFSAHEIEEILIDKGFKIAAVKHWREKLYRDFERTLENKHKSKLISFVAYKPNIAEHVGDWTD